MVQGSSVVLAGVDYVLNVDHVLAGGRETLGELGLVVREAFMLNVVRLRWIPYYNSLIRLSYLE